MSEGGQKIQASCYKISHGYVIVYRKVTIVNNAVLNGSVMSDSL